MVGHTPGMNTSIMTTESFSPRSPKILALCALSTLLLAGLDIASKDWALETLSEPSKNPAPVCEFVQYDKGSWKVISAPTDEQFESHQVGVRRQRNSTADRVLIENYLMLRYTENCAAAFSVLRNAQKWIRNTIFIGAAIIAILALSWMFFSGKNGVLFAAAVPWILGGAIGNVADRFRYGYVVDFIRFHTNETWEWPTFNLADAWITVGIALMVLDAIVEGRRAKKQSET